MPQKSMTNSYMWQCTWLECKSGQRYTAAEMVWRKQFSINCAYSSNKNLKHISAAQTSKKNFEEWRNLNYFC